MRLICSCEFIITEHNGKFLGMMEGVEDCAWDLELWDCPNCGSCRAHRIYKEAEILSLKMEMQRKGFFNEAQSLEQSLLNDRRKNQILRALKG